MTTREEFLEAMARYTLAIATPPYNGVETGNALISAYDAQAARIAELEAALVRISTYDLERHDPLSDCALRQWEKQALEHKEV